MITEIALVAVGAASLIGEHRKIYMTGGFLNRIIKGEGWRELEEGNRCMSLFFETGDDNFIDKAFAQFEKIGNSDKKYLLAGKYFNEAICYAVKGKYSLAYDSLNSLNNINITLATNKKDVIRELKSKANEVRGLVDELKTKTQNQLSGKNKQAPLLPEKAEVATKGEYTEVLNGIQFSADGVKNDVAILRKSIQDISAIIELFDATIKTNYLNELAQFEELKQRLLRTDNAVQTNNDKLDEITTSLRNLHSSANDTRSEVGILRNIAQGILSNIESVTTTIRDNHNNEITQIEEVKRKLSQTDRVTHANKTLLICILVMTVVVCVVLSIILLNVLKIN